MTVASKVLRRHFDPVTFALLPARTEPNMAKYRVGIIGRTGKGNYGHGLDMPWQHLPSCEVVAVADEHDGGRAAATTRTGAAKGYADYREMLANERLDIAVICPRWIDAHHEIITTCAEHGCHMYLEKPFCRTLEEADQIVNACEMRHLKLTIAHTNRWTPQLHVVRQMIRDGQLGDILEVRARGKEDASRGGGEDLWVLGSHMLDLMRALFGDVESCYATVRQDGEPVTKKHVKEGNEGIGPLAGDHVESMYRFKNGVNGFFSSRRGAGGSPTRFGLTIYGSKGIVQMQSGFLRPAYFLGDSSWSPGRSGATWQAISSNGVDKPETMKSDGHNDSNMLAARNLLDCIEKNLDPVSNVYDARAATEMIVAVFESHRLGGPVVFPLENRKNPLSML